MNDFFFNCRSTFSPMTKEYMTNTNGYWSFDALKKNFIITIDYQYNPEFGIMLPKRQNFEFKVTEQNGIISFNGKRGALRKL